MGQRRKHMLQSSISQEVQPPADNQHIVRALGSRGGNIVEVQYPSGDTTLCMMPAKFNRKLWVKRGGFLMIEACPEAAEHSGSRVTGTICAVLYEDHIKQLKKHPGVWPAEFVAAPRAAAAAAADGSEGPDVPEASSSGSESDGDGGGEDSAAAAGDDGRSSAAKPAAHGVQQAAAAAADDGGGGGAGSSSRLPAAAAGGGGAGQPADAEEEDEEDSDDGLPPLEQIHNRRVVHHYVTDSDSDEE